MRTTLAVGLVVLAAGCGSHSTDDWLRQMKDPDVVKRREAIRGLGERTADADRAVPALAEALCDENGYVRHDAATTLGKFGPYAKSAVPALTAALKDKEHSVRTASAATLKRIDAAGGKSAGH
jgi:HEAT repeat protein